MSNVDQAIFNLFGEGSSNAQAQPIQPPNMGRSHNFNPHGHSENVPAYYQAMHRHAPSQRGVQTQLVEADRPVQPQAVEAGWMPGLQGNASQKPSPAYHYPSHPDQGHYNPQPVASLHYPAMHQDLRQLQQHEAHQPPHIPVHVGPLLPQQSGDFSFRTMHDHTSAPNHTVGSVQESWPQATTKADPFWMAKSHTPGGGMPSIIAPSGASQQHTSHQSQAAKDVKSAGKKDINKGKQPLRKNKQPVFWSAEEHQQFLEGLKKFGQGNSLGAGGAEMISFFMGGSRTPLQIRSHAQKYFLRERQSSAAGAGQKANLKS